MAHESSEPGDRFVGHHDERGLPHDNQILVSKFFGHHTLPFSYRPVRIILPTLPDRAVIAFAPAREVRPDAPRAGDGYVLEKQTPVKELGHHPGQVVYSQRITVRENLLPLLVDQSALYSRGVGRVTIEGHGRYFVVAAPDINGNLDASREHIRTLMSGLMVDEKTDTEIVVDPNSTDALSSLLTAIAQMASRGGPVRVRLHTLTG